MKKIILLISFILSVALHAETMTVLLSYDWAPYYSFNGNEHPEGLIIDVIEAAAEKVDIEIQYEVIKSWNLRLKAMKDRKFDSIGPLFQTAERSEYLIYNDDNVLYYENNVFIAMKNKQLEFNGNIDDMRGLRIGVVNGYSYGVAFDNATSLKRLAVQDDKQLVKLFASGIRYDTIVGDKLVLTNLLKETEIKDDYEVLEPPFYQAPAFIAFNKEKEKLAEKFAEGMKKIKQSGEYQKIIQKYIYE